MGVGEAGAGGGVRVRREEMMPVPTPRPATHQRNVSQSVDAVDGMGCGCACGGGGGGGCGCDAPSCVAPLECSVWSGSYPGSSRGIGGISGGNGMRNLVPILKQKLEQAQEQKLELELDQECKEGGCKAGGGGTGTTEGNGGLAAAAASSGCRLEQGATTLTAQQQPPLFFSNSLSRTHSKDLNMRAGAGAGAGGTGLTGGCFSRGWAGEKPRRRSMPERGLAGMRLQAMNSLSGEGGSGSGSVGPGRRRRRLSVGPGGFRGGAVVSGCGCTGHDRAQHVRVGMGAGGGGPTRAFVSSPSARVTKATPLFHQSRVPPSYTGQSASQPASQSVS